MKNKIIAIIFAANCSTAFAVDQPAQLSKQTNPPHANTEILQSTTQGAATDKLNHAPRKDEHLYDSKPKTSSQSGAKESPDTEQVQSQPSNLGFWITLAAVIAGSLVNWFLNTRTMTNQTAEATKSRQADHQNKVSEYRHAWLQELRNTASELVKVINEGQSALMRLNLSKDYRKEAIKKGDQELVKENHEQVRLAYTDERVAASEIYKYVAKIKLMFKKNDSQAKKLFDLLDQVLQNIGSPNVRQLDHKIIEEIVAELQIILKSEWEITKARMWQEVPNARST